MTRGLLRTPLAAALAALFLAGSPAIVLAACPGATGELTSTGHGEGITGTINGNSQTFGFAGVIFATINGQPNVPTFCINLLNHISVGDCFNTGGATTPQITWLLNHGYGPDNTLSDAENAARQAAVWYFSDSLITTDSHQARVQQIINAVPADPDPQHDVPQMNIDPPSAVNVLPGNSVHTLTVNVTLGGQPLGGQVVNLSTSFGTLSSPTVTTDGSGAATFTVTNTGGTQGTANITGTFTYLLPAGTTLEPVVEGKQKLVLATPTSAVLVANATKQWVNGGTIISHKFLDSNANTGQDPDEPNLSGWTMQLYSCNVACDGSGCNLISTQTTNANGDASFGARPAGCYRVDEVFPSPVPGHQNWHNTTAASQRFMLGANDAQQVVFGNIIYSVIVVQKFDDTNGNTVQDGGELFLDGWRMMLERFVNGSWIPLNEGLTSGGQIVFSDLPPGHYRVEEEMQAGWLNTTPGNPYEFDVGTDEVVTAKFGNTVPTPTPTHTAVDTATVTNTPEPTATVTETAVPPTNTPVPPTSTETAVPPTDTPVPPTSTETAVPPTDTPVPTFTSSVFCGNGFTDPGEECDDGPFNSDTTPDACRTNCILPRCGDGVPDTPVVDFVLVIENSSSMKRDLQRLHDTLGQLPEQFSTAGADIRIAIVRFGTGRVRNGPDVPNILLDFTTDGNVFRAAADTLQLTKTGPTESGSEALDLALDNLQFRPNAIPVFLVFTDEDDDLPISIERGRRREPPGRTWLTSPRRAQFQARLDAVAQRLIGVGARLAMVMNRRNKPAEFQYGSPRMTHLDVSGQLDVPATLAALTGMQMQQSLQGQLLATGSCGVDYACTAGRVGFPCTTDGECGLPARAYEIKDARGQNLASFFASLRADLISMGSCAP